MLDAERQMPGRRAAQVQVRVAPGVELRGAAKRLPRAGVAGGFLCVMHEEHGEAVPTLQFPQIREERCDLAARVLIDPVQTHEGIEDQQARLQGGDRLLEELTIPLEIESQRLCGDHLYIEGLELAAGRMTDAFESRPHDVLGILGGVEQHATGLRD
jgi:hypothetical protein